MSGDLISQATESEVEIKCVPDNNYALQISELVFSSTTLPIHLFVLIAMFVYRDVVKRNVVNMYASNVIFSSVVANAWRILINGGELARSNSDKFTNITETDAETNKWHTFQEGLNLAMMLVTSGSIGLIIHAMRTIQFRVHRTVGGVASRNTQTECEIKEGGSCLARVRASHKKHPRMWAALYIGLIWAIPLILTLVSTLSNTCKYICHCEKFHEPHESLKIETNCLDVDKSCSSLIPPVGRISLIAGFSLWLFYLLVLTLSLVMAYKDLRLLTRQRRTESAKIATEERNEMNSFRDNSPGPTEKAPNEEETGENKDEEGVIERTPSRGRLSIAVKVDGGKNGTRFTGSIFLRSLRKNFKLLLLMYLSYLVGTAPVSVTALVDAIWGKMKDQSEVAVIVFLALPIVGEAVCTIMLVMYLSGVKSSVRSFMVKISRCCQ